MKFLVTGALNRPGGPRGLVLAALCLFGLFEVCTAALVSLESSAPETLALALEEIHVQSYAAFELLIVEDGSSEGSWQVASSYEDRDHRIRLLKNEQNRGLAATMNRLVHEGTSELLAIQEQDDVSIPHRLEFEVGALHDHARVGLVSGVA